MPRVFRIHGDNIVEYERIAKLILEETDPTSVEISLMSPPTIVYNIRFNYWESVFRCSRRCFQKILLLLHI